MIQLTPEELKVLVQARDLLEAKLLRPVLRPVPHLAYCTEEVWLQKGYEGVMGVLKHSVIDV